MSSRFGAAAALSSAVILSGCFGACSGASAGPADEAPDNLYLTELVAEQWAPGKVGAARYGYMSGTVADAAGNPVPNDGALGGPNGLGSSAAGEPFTCVGVDGSAVWKFEEGRYALDGEGDDFVTFASVFAWGRAADGLCSELGRIEASEDGEVWYYNSAATFASHPAPGTNDGGFAYLAVSGLHGNEPTWANVDEDIQAEELATVDGILQWIDVPGATVPRDFGAEDRYLGGTRFDLAAFRRRGDDAPWPAGGRMRYLKLIDDSSILDGQDYDVSWCLGANLMGAMGINTGRD